MPQANNSNLKTVASHHHRLQLTPGSWTRAVLEASIKTAELGVAVLNSEFGQACDLRE